jgi:hypothetical protein
VGGIFPKRTPLSDFSTLIQAKRRSTWITGALAKLSVSLFFIIKWLRLTMAILCLKRLNLKHA